MNADLANIGIDDKLVQKRITTLSDIWNNAAHGDMNKFKTTMSKDSSRTLSGSHRLIDCMK